MRFVTVTIFSFALLAASAPTSPACARPLDVLDDEEEDEGLEQARDELRALERKIARKEIPPIKFEFNSAVLKPQSRIALEMVADLMFRAPHLKLMVFGHTCDIGSEQYNLWLSQKRAQAVKDYLVEVGVLGEYVKAKGFGESKPLVPNESEEERENNRRVEFALTKRWWHSIF
ncbi:OmpA family protein [Elusimicrobiota bacterium]